MKTLNASAVTEATVDTLRHELEAQGRLLDHWAQALWETDGDGMVVVDSPSWRAYTGQTPEEWLGEGWLNAIHPDDRAFAERQWRKTTAGRGLVDAEFRLRAPDGGWRWTNVRATPVLGPGGDVEKWIGINTDIHAQRLAQAALSESEERLQLALEATDLAIYEWDLVTDRLNTNARFKEVVGIDPSEPVIGADVMEHMVHADDRAWIDPVLARAMDPASDGKFDFEHRLSRDGAHGHPWVLSHGQVYFTGPAEARRPARVFGTLQDITERKLAEQALREGKERHAFLLKLSDAVRPLAGPADIQGEITRLLRDRLNAAWCYYVDWDVDSKVGLVLRDSARDGLPSLAGEHDVSDAPEFLRLLAGGDALAVRDYATYEELPARIRQTFTALGFRSMVAAPLIKEGRLIATLLVGDTAIRDWSASETSLLVEVAERTWATVERARAEVALRESEKSRRLALDSGRMGAWSWDTTRDRIRGDASFMAVYGFPPSDEAFPLSLFTARMDTEAAAACEAVAARALTPGEEFEGDLALATGPTVGRWVRWRGRADLEVPGLIRGVSFDVTERHRTQEALRESEARLRQFGEASSDVIWIRDAATMQFESVSPAFEAIYGIAPDGVGDDNLRGWAERILEEDREHALASLQRVRAGERQTFEFRVERPDGDVRWLRETDFPMLDAEGRVERIGGVGQDVTQLKQIETALQDSEVRLRTLMEGIPQLVWRAASNGWWTWSSPQWREYTGQSQQESQSLGWLEAVHPDDREMAMRSWVQVDEGRNLDVEFRVRRVADGGHLWHHTRAVPVRDARGGIVEWLGTTTDVEQMKELQERQSVLVAELQHRTRNLIGVVRSIAEQTMRKTGPTEAFRESFSHRLEALARVQGLLSRAEEEPVTLENLIRLELDALGGFDRGDDDQARVSLHGPRVPLRSSIVQTFALALHELATNARKHGALAGAGGRLHVDWKVEDEDDAARRRLKLVWRESGVRPRTDAPSVPRNSYGRELIERALPYALGATTTFELTADGVFCTVDLPLAAKEDRSRSDALPAREQRSISQEPAVDGNASFTTTAVDPHGEWMANWRHDTRNALSNLNLALRVLRGTDHAPPERAFGVAQRASDELRALLDRLLDSDGKPSVRDSVPGERQDAQTGNGAIDFTGRRILVVEDDYLLAHELVSGLASRGATVIGPAATVEAALGLVAGESHIDGAVLDVNLQAGRSYPVADVLLQRKVPFVFATGYDASAIPDRYAGVVRCEKPADLERVAGVLFG